MASLRARTLTVASLLFIGGGACAYPHEMELATPAASHCPERTLPAATTAPPDTTELRWYRPTEERDRELGRRWCETVGPAEMRLRPAGLFPGWTAESGLEISAWNIQIGGGDLLGFIRDEMGLDCAPATPDLADDARPFILLLQEVWRYSADLPVVEGSSIIPWTIDPEGATESNPDIVEVADRCGLALVYVPSARNGPDDGARPREDKGNAILSTLPLTTPIAVDLPLEGGRKVAIAATVAAPGGERVRVVTVHLDVASTLVRTLLSGNQTRMRQASGLVDGLDKAERDGPLHAATIVGGDFNTWAGNEATLKMMRQEFPESAEWDRLGSRGPYPTDHIFFGGPLISAFGLEEYRLLEDAYGSDHQARRMRLTYSPVVGAH